MTGELSYRGVVSQQSEQEGAQHTAQGDSVLRVMEDRRGGAVDHDSLRSVGQDVQDPVLQRRYLVQERRAFAPKDCGMIWLTAKKNNRR